MSGAVVEAVVGSVPILGDVYGVVKSFGNRGGKIFSCIKSGDARGAMASAAALGVETAGEAFIPDNPAIGALHAATGQRPEEMLGDLVEGAIAGEGNNLHVEGQQGQGQPVQLTDKQRESLNEMVEELRECVEKGKDIPEKWKECAAKLEALGGSAQAIENAKGMLATEAEVAMVDKALEDGEVTKDEAEEIAEFREGMAAAGAEMGDAGDGPVPGATGEHGAKRRGGIV